MSVCVIVHATAVAVGNRGVIITGQSGSGKSSLALQLMAYGAILVADDRVELTRQSDNSLFMRSPKELDGKIEARNLGLIAARSAPAIAVLHVDLDHVETERLPQERKKLIAGGSIPSLRRVESPAFPAMLMACLNGGRIE